MLRGYLGIDPSLTGLALVDGLGNRHIVCTKADQFPCFPARLDHLLQEASRFVQTLRPVLAAIERPAYSRGEGTSGKTVERNGLYAGLQWMLWRAGVPYLDVASTTLKKFVTGRGDSEKSLMLREVWRKWQYEAKDDNDADAFGLSQLAEAWAEGGDAQWLIQLRKVVPLTLGRGSSGLALPAPSPTTLDSSSVRRRGRTRSPALPKSP